MTGLREDPNVVYRCADCGLDKPLTPEHFYFTKEGFKRSGACRLCKQRRQREHADANRDEWNRRRRERHKRDMQVPKKRRRKRAQWRRANKKRQARPEGREALRRAARKYRAKIMADPARRAEWNEQHRAISRRYYEKLKQDPRRHAAYLAYKRGERSTTVPDPVLVGQGGGLVPAAPLREIVVAWLDRAAAAKGSSAVRGRGGRLGVMSELAAATGIGERTIFAIREGEREQVSVDAADRICIALGVHLIDVYPELYEFDEEESEAA